MRTRTRMRVNEDGRVVIPTSFRAQLGIRAGDGIVLQLENGELRILTRKRELELAQCLIGKHVKPGRSLADELMAERHASARHD